VVRAEAGLPPWQVGGPSFPPQAGATQWWLPPALPRPGRGREWRGSHGTERKVIGWGSAGTGRPSAGLRAPRPPAPSHVGMGVWFGVGEVVQRRVGCNSRQRRARRRVGDALVPPSSPPCRRSGETRGSQRGYRSPVPTTDRRRNSRKVQKEEEKGRRQGGVSHQ